MPELDYIKLAQTDYEVIKATYWEARAFGEPHEEAIDKAIDQMLLVGFDKEYWLPKVKEIVGDDPSEFIRQAFSLRNINKKVIQAFLDKEPAEGGRKPDKYQIEKYNVDPDARQWNTDGEKLRYYTSEVAWYDGDDVVVSDAGYHTITTRTLLNGIFQVTGAPYSVGYEHGQWYIFYGGKNYRWTGTLKMDGSVPPVDQDGNPLDEIPPDLYGQESRQLSTQINRDIKAIENAILEKEESNVYLDMLSPDIYGEEIVGLSLYDLMYYFNEKQGYGDPDFVTKWVYNMLVMHRVSAITGISAPVEDKFTISYNFYEGKKTYEQEGKTTLTREEMQGKTTEEIIEMISEDAHLSKDWGYYKKDVRKALRYYARKKRMEEQAGREYEAIR
jgi:hypothetical protein